MTFHGWLIAGAIFLVLEIFLPGGVVGALGVAALLLALFVWLGWVTGFLPAVAIWTALVLVLLLALRPLMRKLYPSETTRGNFDEDSSAIGSIVLVIESIPAGGEGRVILNGTSWKARFQDPADQAIIGASVRLLRRENILWYVENIETKGTSS